MLKSIPVGLDGSPSAATAVELGTARDHTRWRGFQSSLFGHIGFGRD